MTSDVILVLVHMLMASDALSTVSSGWFFCVLLGACRKPLLEIHRAAYTVAERVKQLTVNWPCKLASWQAANCNVYHASWQVQDCYEFKLFTQPCHLFLEFGPKVLRPPSRCHHRWSSAWGPRSPKVSDNKFGNNNCSNQAAVAFLVQLFSKRDLYTNKCALPTEGMNFQEWA